MRRVRALLKSRIAADGTDFVQEHVPIGREYWVILGTDKPMTWGNNGKLTSRRTIHAYDGPECEEGGFYPLELLESFSVGQSVPTESRGKCAECHLVSEHNPKSVPRKEA